MTEPAEEIFASIGKAVVAAQYFEQWLVAAYYHMRIATESGFKLDEAQLSDYRLFKIPTRNLLTALSTRSLISADLENRISVLLEQRHAIVHRWFLLNGSPSAHTPSKWLELKAICDSTSREAHELSFLLVSALRDWLEQSLQGAPQDELDQRMLRLFQQS